MTNNVNSANLGFEKEIFQAADKLRGNIDAAEYKSVVLGLIFLKYISDSFEERFQELVEDGDGFEEDRDEYLAENIFFVPEKARWNYIASRAMTPEIGKVIDQAMIDIEEENDRLRGILPKNYARPELDKRRLGEVVDLFNNLKLKEQGNSKDILGRTYEYAIAQFAELEGKRAGEFYTPSSIVRTLVEILEPYEGRVYDPCCGSGSLLLQMKKQFDQNIIDEGFFGQEINMTNFNLARMNMFLHNVNYNNFSIKRGDTLINPLHNDEKPFDAIVSNPPYSIKWIGDKDPTLINDERFAPAGKLAPKSYADYAFIMHSLAYLSSKGRAAIVCFPGIFYRRGAEKTIRKYLIDNNFIDCVIQLPENLFFGTSIATCVLVMAKNKTENKILFVDATKEFKKETNNNILEEKNIKAIVDEFRNREEKEYFSRYVDIEEIVENEYNLSVSTYVEKEDTREKIDIKVLNKEIEETVAKIDKLRASIDRIVKELEDE